MGVTTFFDTRALKYAEEMAKHFKLWVVTLSTRPMNDLGDDLQMPQRLFRWVSSRYNADYTGSSAFRNLKKP